MSKAEKLKKLCKKVWNLIIPIIIISAIIGATLIAPKYYNKSGGGIETAELTVSPSYNWEILATSILGGFFLAILILVLILNSRRKSSKSAAGVGKFKMSYGGGWNWIIPIVIISAIIGGILIVPKYYNKDGGIGIGRSAFYSWKKLDDQYGYNPDQRSSGPLETTVTKYDEKKLSFIVYPVRGSKKYGVSFNGHRNGKNDLFKGVWIDPFNNMSGRWELVEDIENPGVLRGLEYDDYCTDGKPLELVFQD